MNFEQERKMARDIQGSLHGATLVSKVNMMEHPIAPMGWIERGIIGSTGSWSPSGGEIKSQKETDATTDSERMIRYLDYLTGEMRKLNLKAVAKLGQFRGPGGGVKVCGDAKVDNRQCSSNYFRILESRIEMLSEYCHSLEELIDDVSAPIQGVESACAPAPTTY